jgi:hypothetical protein
MEYQSNPLHNIPSVESTEGLVAIVEGAGAVDGTDDPIPPPPLVE